MRSRCTSDFRRRDPLERQTVADAFVDDAAQALREAGAGVLGRQRRLRGDAGGEFAGAPQQRVGAHDSARLPRADVAGTHGPTIRIDVSAYKSPLCPSKP